MSTPSWGVIFWWQIHLSPKTFKTRLLLNDSFHVHFASRLFKIDSNPIRQKSIDSLNNFVFYVKKFILRPSHVVLPKIGISRFFRDFTQKLGFQAKYMDFRCPQVPEMNSWGSFFKTNTNINTSKVLFSISIPKEYRKYEIIRFQNRLWLPIDRYRTGMQ